MKKFFIISFAILMMMAMATTAFAAETTIDTDNGQTTIDVKAVYHDGVTTVNKTSVNVSWDAMEFTYSTGGTSTWDEKTHTYKTSNPTAGWTGDGKTVTVTNHSDSAIKVDFSFTAEADYSAVTGDFSNNSINLPSAVGKTTTASDLTGTTKLTLGGTLNSSVTTSTKVGTITVKITMVNDAN